MIPCYCSCLFICTKHWSLLLVFIVHCYSFVLCIFIVYCNHCWLLFMLLVNCFCNVLCIVIVHCDHCSSVFVILLYLPLLLFIAVLDHCALSFIQFIKMPWIRSGVACRGGWNADCRQSAGDCLRGACRSARNAGLSEFNKHNKAGV